MYLNLGNSFFLYEKRFCPSVYSLLPSFCSCIWWCWESCTGDEECSGALLCENAVCSSPKKGTVEVVAQTVAVNETQKNLEEEMNSGGITSDNPFLGWADTLVDTVQSKTSNDPSVQKKIVQEALDESQFLDQRKERGQISETSYLKAKTKSGEKRS